MKRINFDTLKGSLKRTKQRKPVSIKKATSVPKMSTPVNQKALLQRRKSRKDAKFKRKAEFLASLPKSRVKRILYRLEPKRLASFLFSRDGAIFMLKAAGLGVAAVVLLTVIVFTYYRQSLPSDINGELAKVKQTTKFYDRTGKILLYEAYGDQNRTVVPIDQMSFNIQKATIALEDKNFYKHGGFDPKGVLRAFINNITGRGDQQGGSTLTQQFVKNLLFTDTKYERSYTRKIKELILSIELERQYSKDQILAFYLNQIPYGPTEYGIEAASKSYFNKDAKDLTVDEAAMLASIPQQPPAFNPYREANKDRLRTKQLRVIDLMQEQGYIKKDEADAAKKVDTFAKIVPLDQKSRYTTGNKVPHFMDEVEDQLVDQLGKGTVYEGGLKVITTVDMRLQNIALDSMNASMRLIEAQGADDANIVAIDNTTGQVLAYVGSRDYNYPGFGNVDTLQSLLQPGSSIKPFDYAELFKDRPGQDYAPGTIMKDEPIDINGYKPGNSDGTYKGSMTIRTALGQSRNTTAIKAAYISGMDNIINLAHEMGDKTFCTRDECGLSAAIGGARVVPVEHANAFASLARGGVYKDVTYVLKVENASGKTIKEWKDDGGKPVLNGEVAYLISDILSDDSARAGLFGRNSIGFNVPGVKVAAKSGTTDDGTPQSRAKDSWLMGYSSKITVGTWVGNHDGRPLLNGYHTAGGTLFGKFMERAHKEVLAADGTWKTGDWLARPAGIKTLTVGGRTDIYPSWYSVPKNGKDYTMDKVSKKKATDCTPDLAKETITSVLYTDAVTKKDTEESPEGYDITKDDDVHHCSDAKPSVSLTSDDMGGGVYRLTANYTSGSNDLTTADFYVNDSKVYSTPISGNGTVSYDYTSSGGGSLNFKVQVIDKVFYDATDTASGLSAGSLSPSASKSGNTITVDYNSVSSAHSYRVTFSNTSNGGSYSPVDADGTSPYVVNANTVKAAPSLLCGASCSVNVSVTAYSGNNGNGSSITSSPASGSPISL